MVDNTERDAAVSSPRHGQAQVLHLPCGSHSAWFVAETHPGRDAEALDRLRDQGFTAYQPVVLERRAVRRKTTIVHAPMFPGYLFVALDLTAPGWRSAFHTRGIRAFLCHAPERPTPVPAAVIQLVAENAAALDAELRGQLNQPVAPGERVKVKVGPWAGFDGVCLWSSRHRIRIMLTLFGRDHEAEMAVGRVERA
jgi:transcriptional antiterminator RfaH